MYEIAQFVNRTKRYSTAINKNPKGAQIPYSIVGTVPLSACNYTRRDGTPGAAYDTEEAAKQALIAIGMPFFQLADCSWYPRRPETPEDQAQLDKFWNA
jgi:hypothetical protein